MIVFINGPFGVGKTTVAERLVARLPGSMIFDAELVGAFLRRVLGPLDQPDDFQDLALWRQLTVTTATLLRATYGRTLVMPTTIWRPDYLAEIVGGLRAAEPELHHFTLVATAQTLEARIRASGEAVEWRLAHVARCLAAFGDPLFATQIATDGKMPDAIVAELCCHLPAAAGVD